MSETPTEREIAEVLAPILAPYLVPCEPATRQAARAVVERVVAPLQERITALQGFGSGHLHRCARVNGRWACDPACRIADRDDRLARLVEAATRLADDLTTVPMSFPVNDAWHALKAVLAGERT